jgi:hypothetical protein
MEFLIMISLHLIILVVIVSLISGLLRYFIPKFPPLFILGLSAVIGSLYCITYEVKGLLLSVIIMNVVVSLASMGFVKLINYVKNASNTME